MSYLYVQVINKTEFMSGLYTTDEMNSDNVQVDKACANLVTLVILQIWWEFLILLLLLCTGICFIIIFICVYFLLHNLLKL